MSARGANARSRRSRRARRPRSSRPLAAALGGAGAARTPSTSGSTRASTRARAPRTSRSPTLPETRRAHPPRRRARVPRRSTRWCSSPSSPFVEDVAARASPRAGVDALIVQDPAVALLARAVVPGARGARLHADDDLERRGRARSPASLGVTRVVVPRELSVAEIRRFAAGTDLELEVFVHGALCVVVERPVPHVARRGAGARPTAASARSRAACRTTSCVDGDDARPRRRAVPALAQGPRGPARGAGRSRTIGVHGLKIEGRQKGAAVRRHGDRERTGAGWTRSRAAPAPPTRGARTRRPAARRASRTRAASRDGFLGGSDHQTLVEGRFPKHRGVYLGRVVARRARRASWSRAMAGRPWTGALAADGRAQAPRGTPSAALRGLRRLRRRERRAAAADARAARRAWASSSTRAAPRTRTSPAARSSASSAPRDGWRLGFGTPGPDLARVRARPARVGDERSRRSRATAERARRGARARRAASRWTSPSRGAPASRSRSTARARGAHAPRPSSASPLAPARGRGARRGAAARQARRRSAARRSALGALDARGLAPGLHLPVSELKALRRALVAALLPQVERGPRARGRRGGAVAASRAARRAREPRARGAAPERAAARRRCAARDEQLEAVIARGPARGRARLDGAGRASARAVARARARGAARHARDGARAEAGRGGLRPRASRRSAPDAVLVRHWGALVHFRSARRRSGARPRAARRLLAQRHQLDHRRAQLLGARPRHADRRRTTSTAAQLLALLERLPRRRASRSSLHHHIPTFHTEHCVYAHLLSDGPRLPHAAAGRASSTASRCATARAASTR